MLRPKPREGKLSGHGGHLERQPKAGWAVEPAVNFELTPRDIRARVVHQGAFVVGKGYAIVRHDTGPLTEFILSPASERSAGLDWLRRQ